VDTSVITTGAATSFTAVTGQTVTINRSTSGRKTVAVTQPTWLFGTDDYMEVNNRYMAHSTSAENYVYLSGATSNYMSVADSPPLDITGDIDIQVKVALDDWTPSVAQMLLSKWNVGGINRSYFLYVNTDGKLNASISTTGSNAINYASSVTTGVTDGTTKWIRFTRVASTGVVQFLTSDNGTTWTQLGTDISGTSGNIYSGTGNLEIGSYEIGQLPARGKFFRSIIKNGIDGTTVLDADASVITLPSQTTFVDRSSNAYTVTINKSGVGTFVSTGNYMYLPGVGTNWASTPDSAAVSVTGDIDLRCKVALDDWTPSSAAQFLIFKDAQGGNQRSYAFYVRTDGKLALGWFNDGTNGFEKISTVAPTVSDGATLWVRGTLDVDNGAGGNDVQFFTSNDGTTWTQLGTTITTAGTTNVFDGNVGLGIGSNSVGNSAARGKFFRAQVLNGINGTVAFDANFENSITSLLQTSFTESSTNGATVTINRTGSTFRSAGVIDAGYLYPGATNTFAASATDFLNFGAADSFTMVAVVREWNTGAQFGAVINKALSQGGPGYGLGATGTNLIIRPYLTDGTNAAAATPATGLTAGSMTTITSQVNRTAQTLKVFYGASEVASASTTTVGSASNPYTLTLGRFTPGSANNYYSDMEFIGAAIFRQALTAKNISDINNYFQGRD
jgi:hypothetical protein